MQITETDKIQKLEHKLRKAASKCDEKGELILEAYNYASELHKHQKRKSGEPYIIHPLSVAVIIAEEFQILDVPLLSAALLHDVVEDVEGVSIKHIEERFGKSVAELVDGCTKVQFSETRRKEAKDRTHAKIFLSGSKRLGVIVIKLADRLHNLRTLDSLPAPKRHRIARETLDIYAPLAAKLNMYDVKRELYNWALNYLYPRKSKRVLSHIQQVGEDPNVLKIKEQMEKALDDFPAKVVVRCRTKGLGSYYNHERKTLDIHNAENFVDFTIVIYDEDHLLCYLALGIINSIFPPQPKTIRDFIANPRVNGYRSLHARFNHLGNSCLVKIRTLEMDTWAHSGILRRWREDREFFRAEHDDEIAEFLQVIGAYGGPAPERKKLLAASDDEIEVYTPEKDTYILPKDSTVLDFAYKVHSDLGDRCYGARINNRRFARPVDIVQNGEIIEILTQKDPVDFDPEYEIICKTAKAKFNINRLIQKRRRLYAQKIGEDILLQFLKKRGVSSEILKQPQMWYILKRFGLKSDSELFMKIGQDLISLSQLEKALIEVFPEFFDKEDKDTPLGFPEFCIFIDQLDNAIHKFAQCCKPFPGIDPCIAVLSERGVTFHRHGCRDLVSRHGIPVERLFRVEWLVNRQWNDKLAFSVVIQDTPSGTVLARWPHSRSFEILNLKQQRGKYGRIQTSFTVVFQNMEEARDFFKGLTERFDRIFIEGYKKYGLVNSY